MTSFAPNDGFLRRTAGKRYIKNGVVGWEAFKPREGEDGLSFTYQSPSLQSPEGIRSFQLDKVLPSGDLPGICKLTYSNLAVGLSPPLLPRFKMDLDDAKYGALHCLTELPQDQEQMEAMAQLASRNTDSGLPIPFVPKEKRIA